MRRKKGGKAGFENPYCGPSIQLIFGEKKKKYKIQNMYIYYAPPQDAAKVYKRNFYCNVLINPVRYIHIYI